MEKKIKKMAARRTQRMCFALIDSKADSIQNILDRQHCVKKRTLTENLFIARTSVLTSTSSCRMCDKSEMNQCVW